MKVVIGHFDDKVHGALQLKGSWSIVMKAVMEHCNYRGRGSFC